MIPEVGKIYVAIAKDTHGFKEGQLVRYTGKFKTHDPIHNEPDWYEFEDVETGFTQDLIEGEFKEMEDSQ